VRGAREDVLKFRLAHNDLESESDRCGDAWYCGAARGRTVKLLSDLHRCRVIWRTTRPSVQMMKSRIAGDDWRNSRLQGRYPVEATPARRSALRARPGLTQAAPPHPTMGHGRSWNTART